MSFRIETRSLHPAHYRGPALKLILLRLLASYLSAHILRFPLLGSTLLTNYHWNLPAFLFLVLGSLSLCAVLLVLDQLRGRIQDANRSGGTSLQRLVNWEVLLPAKAQQLVYRLAFLLCLLACAVSPEPSSALFFLFPACLMASLDARAQALPRWARLGLGLGFACFVYQLLRSGIDGFLNLSFGAYEQIFPAAPLSVFLSLALGLLAGVSWLFIQDLRSKKRPDTVLALNGEAAPKLLRRLIPALAVALSFCLLSFFLLSRSLTLRTPSFDHGIFHQAYDNMLRGLGPLSSFERDHLLSHFAVHISPSLYLLLPFYALLPNQLGLQALQILSLLLGLIPLRLLLQRLKLPRGLAGLLQALYLFFPPLLCSTGYDFHENVLLPPLILGLAWALCCRRPLWTLLLGLATLGVKEDAFLYVFFLSLFSLAARSWLDQLFCCQKSKSDLLFGWLQAALPLLALLYFALCLSLLQTQGDGAMTGRFANLFLQEDWGLVSIPLGLFQEPVAFFNFAAQAPKLGHLSFFLLGLGGLILRPSQASQLLLFAPLLLMNLLSNYVYQFNIRFQYNFASGALLFFLALLLLAERWQASRRSAQDQTPESCSSRHRRSVLRSWQGRQAVLVFALCFSLCFSARLLFEFGPGPNYLSEREQALRMEQALANYRGQPVPSLVSHYLCSSLLPNNQLYLSAFHKEGQPPAFDPQIRRLIFDLRNGLSPREEDWRRCYQQAGYREKSLADGLLLVLEAPDLAALP